MEHSVIDTKRALLVIAVLGVVGCGDTGQTEVTLSASAVGAAPSPVASDGYEVTLSVARVGFGPIYFCATAAASADLCPVAQAELSQAVLVDVLSTTPAPLPDLAGVTGTIRSAAFDYGVTWLAVEQGPTGHVPALGEHAAHFEGTFRKGSAPARAFVADVTVAPQLQGTQSVQGAATTVEVMAAPPSLLVAFEPNAWWSRVDLTEFDDFDDFDGDPIVVPPSSRAHSALVAAMTATHVPRFEWTKP